MTNSICQIMGIFLFLMFYRHSGSTANQSQTTVCYVVQLKKNFEGYCYGKKMEKSIHLYLYCFLISSIGAADYREIAEKK